MLFFQRGGVSGFMKIMDISGLIGPQDPDAVAGADGGLKPDIFDGPRYGH